MKPMINILTGPLNSGKSTRFLRLYQESGGKDIGLFSLKQLDDEGRTIGYDLCLLPEGEQLPLARLSSAYCCCTNADYLSQGRFVFSHAAFEYATSHVLRRLSAASTVWIDEVGKLEVRGLGYSFLLHQLLEKRINVTLTIRDRYLPAFLSAYNVSDFLIL